MQRRSFHPLPTVLLTALLLTGLPSSLVAQSALSGADSAAAVARRQLDLGEQWFQSACLSCHAIGAVTDDDFRLKWNGRSAFDLFDRIRSTMPAANPGSLTQSTYAAIVAYLMKANGMPARTRAVSRDSSALAAIRLVFPPTTTTGR